MPPSRLLELALSPLINAWGFKHGQDRGIDQGLRTFQILEGELDVQFTSPTQRPEELGKVNKSNIRNYRSSSK